jgi:hypothetical protein
VVHLLELKALVLPLLLLKVGAVLALWDRVGLLVFLVLVLAL